MLSPQDGLETVSLILAPDPCTSVSYELWAERGIVRSGKGITGSLVIELDATVERAYQAAWFQGKRCHIEINKFGGSNADENVEKGVLGYIKLHENENYFGVEISVKDRCASDLMALWNLYKPTADSQFKIRLDIMNERGFSEESRGHSSGRWITYEIVRFFGYWNESDE